MRTLRRKSIVVRYTPLVAAVACALAAWVPLDANATTYTVTNNLDGGTGSLRDALNQANASCTGVDVINFSGPFVISPAVSLDATCGGLVVNGTDMAGVQISGGSYFVAGGCGISANAPSPVTLRSLEISGFNYGGPTTGACGKFFMWGNRVHDNYNGINANSGSQIGDGSVAGRNFIYSNAGTGILVSYGGVIQILNNYVGTLDGSSAAQNGNGISGGGGSSSSLISGNVVSSISNGISLSYDNGTRIQGNRIGTDASGTSILGNGLGISLNFSRGTTVDTNLISGNSGHGIYLSSDTGSSITGNRIGTNSSGSAALANGTGISAGSPTGTLIENNTISASSSSGISLSNATNVLIKDNYIGTNVAGNAALPNLYGVDAFCGTNVTLQNNLVSGNSLDGVRFSGVGRPTPASPNILYNRIGIGNGGVAIPNGGDGLLIQGGDCLTTANYNGLLQNFIANNLGVGVELAGGFGAGIGTTLSQNEIYANGVKNIDINNNYGGPLPIHPGSVNPGGANDQQNYPVIDSVVPSGGNTTVSFTLESAPSSVYHIEIFENPAMGAPAARTYRADTFLPSPAVAGPVSGSYTLTGLHNYISLTATVSTTSGPGVVGDTSELSPMGAFVPTPGVSLSSTSIDFGSVDIGTSSPTQSVTASSVGTGPYVINTFDSGPACYGGPFCYGGDFTCSTTCSTSTPYAPGTSCQVSASFHPTFTGLQSTTIYMCDNAAGSPRSIMLSGNGVVPPPVTISPAQWDFGNTLVGAKSPFKTFTVINSGTTATPIGTVFTTGAFMLESTTCATEVAPSSSCSASVSFLPTQPGFASGSINVPGSTPKTIAVTAPPPGTASAALYGTGIQNAELTMPSSVNVGSYTLGTSPISIVVTLSNTGNAVLTFSSITTAAPFTVINNCPVNLPPGGSCSVTVGFSNTTVGTFNGTLTVVSNAPGGSRAVPLGAVAQLLATPLIHVSPTFIGYGNRMFGTQSDSQRIAVVNDGGALATLSPFAVSVDYLIVGNTCGLTLASQATCFADVAFRPLGFGPRPGQFTFTSNSANSPHSVDMLGTGCRPFTVSGRGATSACAP